MERPLSITFGIVERVLILPAVEHVPAHVRPHIVCGHLITRSNCEICSRLADVACAHGACVGLCVECDLQVFVNRRFASRCEAHGRRRSTCKVRPPVWLLRLLCCASCVLALLLLCVGANRARRRAGRAGVWRQRRLPARPPALHVQGAPSAVWLLRLLCCASCFLALLLLCFRANCARRRAGRAGVWRERHLRARPTALRVLGAPCRVATAAALLRLLLFGTAVALRWC
jgi:hypothetical protein